MLKLTDAASDDLEITGIYFTISDIKINGKPIRNFSPKTIEISSLKNGNTEVILNKELAAKQYNQISIQLSSGSGTAGDTKGCYVVTSDSTYHSLINDGSTNTEITLSKEFELLTGNTTTLVADIDLRKAIIRNQSGASSYSFVTPSELKNSIRVVSEDSTGTIYGTVSSRQFTESEIYVLIYKANEFQASVEGTGNGPSKILFPNAVTSNKMDSDGSYMLPFLEPGEYDIRLAQFVKLFSEEYTFYRFLPTTSRRTGVQLNNISIEPGITKEIDIEIFRLF